MKYFVYILFSEQLNVFYKRFSINFAERFTSHIQGKNNFTSKACDWKIVYSKESQTKKVALIEEKRLKKLNRISIEKIISIY